MNCTKMQFNVLGVISQIATSDLKHTKRFWIGKKITGVKQGSILSPLLFNIFLNSIFFKKKTVVLVTVQTIAIKI